MHSRFIVRDARVFRGIWFDFIYPHNSSFFFATPQIYVAADKNKIYSPALLWDKHLPTCIFTRSYTRQQSSHWSANKICKQTFYYCSLSSPYINLEIPTNSAWPVTKSHNIWVQRLSLPERTFQLLIIKWTNHLAGVPQNKCYRVEHINKLDYIQNIQAIICFKNFNS